MRHQDPQEFSFCLDCYRLPYLGLSDVSKLAIIISYFIIFVKDILGFKLVFFNRARQFLFLNKKKRNIVPLRDMVGSRLFRDTPLVRTIVHRFFTFVKVL